MWGSRLCRFIIIPNIKRHPNSSKTDQLPIIRGSLPAYQGRTFASVQHIDTDYTYVDPHIFSMDEARTIVMKPQQPGGRSEISSFIDKINDCVMNSERSLLVRGSDPY